VSILRSSEDIVEAYVEYSKLELTIERVKCPSEEGSREFVKETCQQFGVDEKTIKSKYSTANVSGDRVTIYLELRSTVPSSPIVGMLEWFTYLLGNIKIFKRVIHYGKNNKRNPPSVSKTRLQGRNKER